jgi:phospholipid/cholesterol/gamma-HCH transport system substrate-binding protein
MSSRAVAAAAPLAITSRGSHLDQIRAVRLGAHHKEKIRMRRNLIETVMGAVVLVVAAIFMLFAYSTADIQAVEGYPVTAKFDRIDGIREGSDVRMSGIKIGTVVKQILDAETYLAVVTMTIDPAVKLPSDTSAQITSDGLLGDKYMSLSPGGADEMIPAGGEIETTQGSIDLFSLVGQMIFSQTGKGDKKEGDGGK